MFTVQVCHRIPIITGHSKKRNLLYWGPGKKNKKKTASIWCDHHLLQTVQRISFAYSWSGCWLWPVECLSTPLQWFLKVAGYWRCHLRWPRASQTCSSCDMSSDASAVRWRPQWGRRTCRWASLWWPLTVCTEDLWWFRLIIVEAVWVAGLRWPSFNRNIIGIGFLKEQPLLYKWDN